MGPSVTLMLVAVELVAPPKQGVVGVPYLPNERAMLLKKACHSVDSMAQDLARHCVVSRQRKTDAPKLCARGVKLTQIEAQDSGLNMGIPVLLTLRFPCNALDARARVRTGHVGFLNFLDNVGLLA